MNRRGFFGSLIALAVTPVLAKIEPILPQSWRPSSRLTSYDAVMREALRTLHRNSNFMAAANRRFDPSFQPSGETITFRMPKRHGSP